MTWGGLPSSVPLGYIGYFCLPAVIGAAIGRRLIARFGWRRPHTLLIVGLVVGFCWALLFNAGLGARLGVFYYAYVIPGLGLFEGTLHQYPIYDAIAMGIQMMVFTYLLGRTDSQGRNVIEMWSDKVSKTQRSVGHRVHRRGHRPRKRALRRSVFAPHLVTKQLGYVTSGPGEQLFPGVAKPTQISLQEDVAASSPTVELYYDPFDLRDRRRSVPGVETDAGRSAAVLQREVQLLCAESVRRRRARTPGLADLSVGTGHHGRHPVQRHRGAAGHPAVRGPAAARPAPATAVAGLHASPDAGGRGSGARILCHAHWIPFGTPTVSTSSPTSARSCRCARSATCWASPRKASSRSATATTRASRSQTDQARSSPTIFQDVDRDVRRVHRVALDASRPTT